MVKVLSLDLRERVVAAIDGGMSRRQAAERFGVGIATAIRWAQLAREKGSTAPMKVGGDRRSERIERHAGFILGLVETTPDLTLTEVRERLMAERSERFGVSTIWRFFGRHRVTLKKRPGLRWSRTARTS